MRSMANPGSVLNFTPATVWVTRLAWFGACPLGTAPGTAMPASTRTAHTYRLLIAEILPYFPAPSSR